MSYEERRVRVKVYGTTASSSGLLVPIAGVYDKPRRLHTLAAAAFVSMAEAVKRDLDLVLKVASGWRAHRWQSRKQYESVLVRRFGTVQEGRKWLAYNSPHETGLAIDIGVGGLWPSRSTAAKQKQQPLHKWLVANAHEFGWHPYKVEPWHWEFPMSLQAFASGVVAPDDPGPPVQNESYQLEGTLDDEWALEDEDFGELSDEEAEAMPPEAAALLSDEEVEAPQGESARFPGEAPKDEPHE